MAMQDLNRSTNKMAIPLISSGIFEAIFITGKAPMKKTMQDGLHMVKKKKITQMVAQHLTVKAAIIQQQGLRVGISQSANLSDGMVRSG